MLQNEQSFSYCETIKHVKTERKIIVHSRAADVHSYDFTPASMDTLGSVMEMTELRATHVIIYGTN